LRLPPAPVARRHDVLFVGRVVAVRYVKALVDVSVSIRDMVTGNVEPLLNVRAGYNPLRGEIGDVDHDASFLVVDPVLFTSI
jgi:hypothetical protein